MNASRPPAAARRWGLPGLLALLLLIGACATPSQRFHDRVARAGLASDVVQGAGFDHLVVHKDGARDGPLHVYLEGDGTPWISSDTPALDPTPARPLAFELMLRDPAAAIYLGRPCYFGVGLAGCSALTWTNARYSDAVVASLVGALDRAAPSRPRGVVLIGYSGGGTLAVLMAPRVPDAVAVVTVAANLDVAAWTRTHGYTPLEGSLDPASLPGPAPGAPSVPAWHYVGGRDVVVPAGLARAYALGRPGATVVEEADFDHACCWVDAWAALLAPVAGLR